MFKFNLGESVKVIASGLNGKVMGRTEYPNNINFYMVKMSVSTKQDWVKEELLTKA